MNIQECLENGLLKKDKPSIEKAKFRKPVFPGDQLRFEIKVMHQRNNVWKFSGETFVDNNLVSEAEFTAMVSSGEIEK